MSMQNHIKPISYLKANAAKIAQELKENGQPYVITQNGEAAMVVQSVAEYERKENTIAMLQLTAQAEREIALGNTVTSEQAFSEIRQKLLSKK